jgi:hypothetical protein
VDFWEAENTWYWNAPVSRLSKAIAQWEIYKSIIQLPGEIAEFGTYKAASLIRLATFREIAENAHSRQIVAFDSFGPFPSLGDDPSDIDVSFVERFQAEGGDGLSEDETASILEAKGFANIDLVGGDIFGTLPAYLEKHPALRLALVHVDVDLHAVTQLVLDLTAPLLVADGVFMLDDYGKVAGATRAVDEFLIENPAFTLSRTRFAYAPSVLRRRDVPEDHGSFGDRWRP